MKQSSRTVLFSVLLIAVIALAGCSGAQSSPDITTVRISLGYIPDIQFAPFYVGIEKGIFAEHGLELSIEHRQETEGAKLVATEEIPFAVASGEQVLLGREQGLPLRYVFEWYQGFPVAIAAKPGQNINTPADLAGHSVGVPVREGASYIGLRALLAAGGLSESDIDLQTTGYAQVETLVTDQVDAVVVYVANEPAQLEALGETVTVMGVADHADLVSNGLIIHENADPELVRAMVAAFAESLRYSIDHPDEAFEFSQKYVEGLGDNEAVQREVLRRSIALWEAEQLGYSDRESWVTMQDLLIGIGLLTAEQDVDAAFSNEFLP